MLSKALCFAHRSPSLLKLHEYFIASGSTDDDVCLASRSLTRTLCTHAGRSGRRCFVVTELLLGGELLEALLERGAYSERDARTIFATVRTPVRGLLCFSLLLLLVAGRVVADAGSPRRF